MLKLILERFLRKILGKILGRFFCPSGSDPRCPNDRPEMHELILIKHLGQKRWGNAFHAGPHNGVKANTTIDSPVPTAVSAVHQIDRTADATKDHPKPKKALRKRVLHGLSGRGPSYCPPRHDLQKFPFCLIPRDRRSPTSIQQSNIQSGAILSQVFRLSAFEFRGDF